MPLPLSDLKYNTILPEICVAVTGLVVMMYDAFAPKEDRRGAGYISLAGLLGAIFSVFTLWSQPSSFSFGGMIVTDQLRLFFSMIFLIVSVISVLISMQMLEDEQLPAGEYYALMMFGTTGMLLMGAAGDLATLFLGLEILSITTYVLAGFRRKDLRSNESALKYFVLGSLSTGFLLYGIALIYGATKTTNLVKIQQAVVTGQLTSDSLLIVGAALILVGLCFKVATAPFHVWAPDVYEGAPTPVTAFMAAGPKAAAFVVFLRIFVITFSETTSPFRTAWVDVVSVIAVLSMIIGNCVAVTQTNIKRMLAYSSIAHAGYALLGVLSGNWSCVAFYMLTYVLMTLGAFGVISLLARQGDQKTNIEDYTGIGFKSLGLSLLFMVFLLSLGGIPITAGFMGKFVLFKQSWLAGYHTIVIIAVLNSAISLYYYLRPIVVMFFKEREGDEYVPPRISVSTYAALTFTLIGVLYLGLFPGKILGILDTAQQTLSLQNNDR